MYEGKEICDDLRQEDYLDTVAANDDLQSGQQLLQVRRQGTLQRGGAPQRIRRLQRRRTCRVLRRGFR